MVFFSDIAVSQSKVGKVPYERIHRRVSPFPVFLAFLESAELLL